MERMRSSATNAERFRRAAEHMGWDCGRVLVARHLVQRLLGMVVWGRSEHDADLVMAFPACSSVHTCFMNRRLDIAFLSEGGEVMEVYERVGPWRFLSCRGAVAVLERNAR